MEVVIPSDVRHDELLGLVRIAYSDDAPDVLRWLETPPQPSDTSAEAMHWYAAWTTVLLACTDEEQLTWQAAAQIIRLPDARLMGEVLDRVRQSAASLKQAEVEPVVLTEADFARIFKPH